MERLDGPEGIFVKIEKSESYVVTDAKVAMGFDNTGAAYGVLILDCFYGNTSERRELVVVIPPMLKDQFSSVIKSLESI